MRQLYDKYQGYFPAAFFIGGFIFDLLTTDRIDQNFSLIQQFVYLVLILQFLYWEVVTPRIFLREGTFLAKMWTWHVEVLHFLFGSLLSLYTIFYFKSSSLITSFAFMIFLSALLIINELPRFQKKGISMRAALVALCLSSYFIYLVPVITGEIGVIAFILSMTFSVCLFLWFCVRINKSLKDSSWVNKRVLLPGLIVQIVFVLLYVTRLLPPVPVSLKYIGIYHNIQKQDGDFYLNYERDWWRVWQSGAQTFIKRDGDQVYCFVSIFSPGNFKDKMRLSWYKKTKKGWQLHDNIGLPIVGGRDQGFRGFAYKSNFDLGKWQVRVLTSDEREVGRISFNVVDPDYGSSRSWRRDLF